MFLKILNNIGSRLQTSYEDDIRYLIYIIGLKMSYWVALLNFTRYDYICCTIYIYVIERGDVTQIRWWIMCSNALVWLLLLHVLPVSSEHSPSLTGPDGAGGCQLSVSISLTSQQWEVSTSHSTFFKESTDFMLQQWYWREVMVAGQYNKNIILYIYTLSVAEPACYSGKQQCNVEKFNL